MPTDPPPGYYDVWFDATALQAFIEAAGFTVPDGVDLTAAVYAGIAEAQDKTGFKPLLIPADATAQKRLIPLDGSNVLRLGNGIIAPANDVIKVRPVQLDAATGLVRTPREADIVPNLGYILRPDQASYSNEPFCYIAWQGARRHWAQGYSYNSNAFVEVEALWGWGKLLPADLYLAVLKMAAAAAFDGLSDAAIGVLSSQSHDGESLGYSGGLTPVQRVESWRGVGAGSVIARYANKLV